MALFFIQQYDKRKNETISQYKINKALTSTSTITNSIRFIAGRIMA